MTELPPPGFYADPDDPTRERWWDGEEWGEHARPIRDRKARVSPVPALPSDEEPADGSAPMWLQVVAWVGFVAGIQAIARHFGWIG